MVVPRYTRSLASFPVISIASVDEGVGAEESASRRVVVSHEAHEPLVRSFYFLGKIYERHGEMEKARFRVQRFYDY
jgi:hypothetical protein